MVPPIDEQYRIADYLDSKCSAIDSLMENIEAQITKLDEYKKSVITQAVTKGLDPNVPMKDSGVEWIGEIPRTWEICRFKYLASVKSNLVSPLDYTEYPQVSPDNIEKDSGRLLSYSTVEESGVISPNHLFFAGQILYSKIRPNLNKVTIAPFDGLCSADMYPIEVDLDREFALYMILSSYFTEQVSLVIGDRVKMPKINQDELGRILVAIPPLDEQRAIAHYLHMKCSAIDSLKANLQAKLTDLADYKKSLIFDYVTGKKEVPESFRKEAATA